ncbi:MAG: DISARM system phospholipase D-like protein DrmC [Myxococcales bacterium]|nr:DISARM system phospholipase D-like protein DrmC [Myxococcales bacterium]
MSLARVSLAELERLHAALSSGRLAAPLTALGLSAAGFRLPDEALALLQGRDADQVTALCDVAIAERRRPTPHVDLVWTGPDTAAGMSRQTSLTICDLFDKAEHDVLLAGYSFDHGQDIFEPLHRAIAERNVRATMVVDVHRGRRRDDVSTTALLVIERLLRENWPFGEPYPAIYYDPRTAEAGSLASMHAKCIVIDQRLSLVGSANFTDRGQTRNIEVGALIDDATFAKRLVGQWFSLISSDALVRHGL